MSKRLTMIDAKVELYDVLQELDDDDILSMLADLPAEAFDKLLRMHAKAPPDNPLEAIIEEAIELLRSGRADDAMLVLERNAHPKFGSLADFESAYRATRAA